MSDLPDLIRCGRALCGDLPQAERREWLVTNGLGGYAAGTVAGTLTRRYHGLLIAPFHPDCRLLFAKADATLSAGEREIPLFSNRWAGDVTVPHGYVHLESFHLEGRMPVWRYAMGHLLLEQRIWMEPGANTTYVAWRLAPQSAACHSVQLTVQLLINQRNHHAQTVLEQFPAQIDLVQPTQWRIQHDDFTMWINSSAGILHDEGNWFENFYLPMEQERGLAHLEHNFCLGSASFTLEAGQWSGIVASLQEEVDLDFAAAQQRFLQRERRLLSQAQAHVPDAPPWIRQLVLAADSFLIERTLPTVAEAASIIAGYPWFGDWGRDTMIALPGLTLATGRYDMARRILRTFAQFLDQGMLPNLFSASGQPLAYNTADAALWYIEAWRAYSAASGDLVAMAEIFPVLQEIIAWHVAGTRFGIGLDSADGLLHCGEPGQQLTWMDAKIGDWVVTPRIGKPVEINALWYNALCTVADYAQQLGQSPAFYQDLAQQARAGFQRFVRVDGEGLLDVVDASDGDAALVRPNQLLAVSLFHSPLERAAQQAVLRICGHELLTSYGLRSLAPRHSAFHAHYVGDVLERDGGYHQGPAWGWLLGHYAIAEYRVHGDVAAALAVLEPIRDHLQDAGLGSVSEIFDGAPPHLPRGAPAQAWSVAGVLQAWEWLSKQRGTVHCR